MQVQVDAAEHFYRVVSTQLVTFLKQQRMLQGIGDSWLVVADTKWSNKAAIWASEHSKKPSTAQSVPASGASSSSGIAAVIYLY